jgi:hypothetical protein
LIASNVILDTVAIPASRAGVLPVSNVFDASRDHRTSDKLTPSKQETPSNEFAASTGIAVTVAIPASRAGALPVSGGFNSSPDFETSEKFTASKTGSASNQLVGSTVIIVTVAIPASHPGGFPVSGGFDASQDFGRSEKLGQSNVGPDSDEFLTSLTFPPHPSVTPDPSQSLPDATANQSPLQTQSDVARTRTDPPVATSSQTSSDAGLGDGQHGDGDPDGVNIALIAGIVAGALVVLGLLILFVIVKRRYLREEETQDGLQEEPPVPLDTGSTFNPEIEMTHDYANPIFDEDELHESSGNFSENSDEML